MVIGSPACSEENGRRIWAKSDGPDWQCRDSRITKEDVAKALGSGPAAEDPAPIETPVPIAQPPAQTPSAPPLGTMFAGSDDERVERRVPMTRLRASVAKRLVRPSKTPLC